MTTRAALYLRVSTKRQAEQDLSIPDQQRQLEAYALRQGWTVAKVYVEPGASATTDERPVFQDMIADARKVPQPFDVVLVHSFSRFARDSVDLELYVRDLAKRSIRLISITQETNGDPMGDMMRKMVAIFDEHSSKENAKHTLRAMKENARQNFWNGAAPPYGYRLIEAERRGDKIKKRLDIEPKEAASVSMIFGLYLNGDGKNGPLGIMDIVKHLNGRGFSQRHGKPFNVKLVHEALRSTTYIGTHYFNRTNCRTRSPKPRSEWVPMSCPAIVDEATFNAVASRLQRNNPRTTAPRTVKSPILLGGLVKCASCGGAMSLRTGKSGRYRYYACSRHARMGCTACKGRSIPMPMLDSLVTGAVLDRVLVPSRVEAMVAAVRKRATDQQIGSRQQIATLHAAARAIDAKIARLFEALENGLVRDGDSFRQRLGAAEREKEENLRLQGQSERHAARPLDALTPRKVEAITRGLADLLATGNVQLRKAYMGLFIDRIDVSDDEVKISGSEAAVIAAMAQSGFPVDGKVPTFIQEWRPHGNSNPGYCRERAMPPFLLLHPADETPSDQLEGAYIARAWKALGGQ